MTNADLDTIFGRYLSRNEANTITALHEAGFCLDDLEYLVRIGAVKRLDFGYDQIHYERRVLSDKHFNKLKKRNHEPEIL